jgi:hypothetical protein
MDRNVLYLSVSILLIIMAACQPSAQEMEPTAASSFDLIQDKILTTNCAFPGCHASQKDGLVLTKNLAYDRLTNIVPQNDNARKDGLKVVMPFNADKSLLYHKIHPNTDGHHKSDYGQRMPLSGKPLKDGEIEFIRRWIDAGAPRTGDLVDKKLLN